MKIFKFFTPAELTHAFDGWQPFFKELGSISVAVIEFSRHIPNSTTLTNLTPFLNTVTQFGKGMQAMLMANFEIGKGLHGEDVWTMSKIGAQNVNRLFDDIGQIGNK